MSGRIRRNRPLLKCFNLLLCLSMVLSVLPPPRVGAATPTPTATIPAATITPTQAPPTASSTSSPTKTPMLTAASATSTSTNTPMPPTPTTTPNATVTPTDTPTPTITPEITATPTLTVTPIITVTPTITPTLGGVVRAKGSVVVDPDKETHLNSDDDSVDVAFQPGAVVAQTVAEITAKGPVGRPGYSEAVKRFSLNPTKITPRINRTRTRSNSLVSH